LKIGATTAFLNTTTKPLIDLGGRIAAALAALKKSIGT
jgi:hypothetical protein